MNKIKQFFTRKRCKKLKLLNNKGFSLIEVLVAVAIIGIISAIAIPQYTKSKNEAAKVAGSTTINNIRKAHQNCLVLKSFGDCDSLGEIGISCSDCTSSTDSSSKFCADFKKGSGSNELKACVSIDGNTTLITYGGDLMEGSYICQVATYDGPNTKWNDWSDVAPLKNCKVSTATTDCGVASVASPSDGDEKFQCAKVNKQGECASNECT